MTNLEIERLQGLIEAWRDEAAGARQKRCLAHAETWDECADELANELRLIAEGENSHAIAE